LREIDEAAAHRIAVITNREQAGRGGGSDKRTDLRIIPQRKRQMVLNCLPLLILPRSTPSFKPFQQLSKMRAMPTKPKIGGNSQTPP
jgi:hypothetical protein